MLKLRHAIIVLGLMSVYPAAASADVSIGVSFSHVSIGINVPTYPRFVRVPGYPVYYAPQLQANFFFYDGMYWVYHNDDWYASYWYNGPWAVVDRWEVPLFVLRIPVRYYRRPPPYFQGWRGDAPPRWGDHWGRDWEQRRHDWDKWDRRAAPAPAPLPSYQQQYSGNRYPRQVEQQRQLLQQKYRYQPREPVVQQHYQEPRMQKAPAQQGRPERDDSGQRDDQRSTPSQQVTPTAPPSQSPQKGGADQRPTPATPQQGRPPVQEQRQPSQPALDQQKKQAPKSRSQQEKEEQERQKELEKELEKERIRGDTN